MAGKLYWHIHHERLVEEATEPIERRIAYIKSDKPKREQATRLRLLKPVKNTRAVRAALKTRDAKLKPLADDYNAKLKPLDDDYNAKRKPLDDDYNAKLKPLDDDYYAKRKTLDDDYYAKLKPLADDYNAKLKTLAEPLEALHRKECKRCPWDGKTIFPGASQ